MSGNGSLDDNGLILGSKWQNEQIEEKDKLISNLKTENTELKVEVAKLESNLNYHKNQSNVALINFFLSDFFIALGAGLIIMDYKDILSISFLVGIFLTLLGGMFYALGYLNSKNK